MRLRSMLRRSLAATCLAALALAGAGAPQPAQAGAGGGAGVPAADARTGPTRVEAVEVELVAENAALAPGQPVRLGLRIRHDPHWHTYWRNPGDSGLATQLAFRLPAGFDAGAIEWPAPRRLFIPPLANYGYEDEVVLPVPLRVPPAIEGERVRFAARASWLMCREVCIPGEADVALELPVQRAGVVARSRFAALFDEAERRMPRQAIAARVFADGETLSIGLPGRPAAVEFFPYREGWLRNAEAQVLYASDGDGVGARLDVRLTEDGARRVREGTEAVKSAAEGIVVIDGKARELAVSIAPAAFAAGSELSRVAGAPQAPAEPARRGLDLPGLRSGSVAPESAALAAPATGLPGSLWMAALFGAVGGLILNLMPCVFPVIGLKVLGFARHGSEGSAGSRVGALVFAAGVVVSFWALAGVLLALRAAGEAAGWGFQLQSPLFVAAMALLFVAIALNFSGVYEIGVSATRLGRFDRGAAASAHPLAGSFGSGVLAVLVATPCTAPFMGSALGYTLGSSTLEALVVFTAIGVGMAAPYVLLGLFPAWLRWLPRPGRWMETFRQVLAFPMYATAAWLAWVLGQQAGIDAVLALAIGAVLLALGLWLTGRFVQQGSGGRRGVAAALAVAALALGLWTAWPRDVGSGAATPMQAGAESIAWQPWSRERVDDALARGRGVFVDFTAAWCVSCQANKRLVLERDAVVSAMAQRGVLRLRGDWTNRDPAITAELARFGRNGVPLYLMYRPGEPQPQVLPELLTVGLVMDALAPLVPAPVARPGDR
ncbi:MAG TPA: protein-disulfide reductase DsbD family protein [Burkholderiaceae bacterium]|nr:protein-disulfide reductase DsbD family protein [Burkholderiaceae bacterium]